jgi:predicted TIM-barrel fold metal-dependent hydrolase
MYIFCPGGKLYVEAANGFMKEQLLFGSSYPFRPMAQSVADYRELGFKDDVLESVMYRNAERVLKLAP